MLSLEIELLSGIYRASLSDGSGAEWPPHPERMFSALVQAWADGGCNPAERQALRWLETQAPPVIEADPTERVSMRDAPPVYVPPNDPTGVYISRFPDRRRQARNFRAIAPTMPIIRFFWSTSPAADERESLNRMAMRLSSVGHSASLVRAHFRNDLVPEEARTWRPDPSGSISVRIPHPGRLDRLCQWQQAGKRPQSGAIQRYHAPLTLVEEKAPESWFGGAGDWFVFEDNDGPFRPDILGFAFVAQRVRHALMAFGPQPTPTVISGHDENGAPTSQPHLAIVPLQNVGWQYSDGSLLGFALILPRMLSAEERRTALQAIAAFARLDQDEPHSIVQLNQQHAWNVVRTANPSRASLRPGRWCASADVWASATPVILDRFADRGDFQAEAAIVAAACRNIGLPEPIAIDIHKHSAVTGAETTFPARGRLSRPDWSFPAGSKLKPRPRRHVVLRFAAPVAGPVILGAGRYAGFGICLPLDGRS